MKPVVFVIGLFLCALSLSAQTLQDGKEEHPFARKIVSELYFSVNRTLFGDENSRRWGGGLGVNHSFHLGKRVEYLLGTEYIHLSILDKNTDLYNGVPSSSPSKYYVFGWKYSLDYISLPTGFRYNFGKKYNVFLDHGISFGLKINSEMIQILKHVDTKSTATGWNRDFSNTFLPGFFLGTGVIIPRANVQCIVHPSLRVTLVNAPLAVQWKLDVGFKWK